MIDMSGWEKERLNKHGFYTHFVPDVAEEYINCHTHGLEESKEHKDFQIVLPLFPEIALDILWNFVRRINKGEKFESGMRVSEIIPNYDVELLEVEALGNKTVLRIIFPDKNGYFPSDEGCSPLFKNQTTVDVD